VDSRIKFLIGHIMAHPTVDFFQLFSMGELINGSILVAIDTFQNLMNRTAISLEIYKKRDRPSTPFGGQFTIGVTCLAVLITLWLQEARKKKKTE
jgi:hypothetical protein